MKRDDNQYPPGALVVRDYDKLERYVEAFAKTDLPLLILVSKAGTGKSYAVREAVEGQALWIEGSATAFGIYTSIFENNGAPIVIDDVDELFRDKAAVRLLKCLCQTDPVKRLAWYTKAIKGTDVPKSYETTSRTMIIANEWLSLNKNVAAVQDRGLLIYFEPDVSTIHAKVSEWFWDQEIYDFVGHHLNLFPNLSFRNYVNAAQLKESGLDWMDIFAAECGCERSMLVAELLSDQSFDGEEQRAEEFQRRGGGSRRTYFNYKKTVASSGIADASRLNLKVQGKPPKTRAAPGRSNVIQLRAK